MKDLREMKKNNKGFSLVELIVVIAIMVVLIAVLGSAILGYVEEANYSKDVQALDAVDTAMGLLVMDQDANFDVARLTASETDGCTLAELMAVDGNDILLTTMSEILTNANDTNITNGVYTFDASSEAFEGLTTADIQVAVGDNNVISIIAPVAENEADDFNPYISGRLYDTDAMRTSFGTFTVETE
ncbi:MAG: type II secretion system protein [Lachnospiraceae bacterium]|nr:type II secretion system protein [Lachnospiraceae bacterium]